jgi:hypothetical protein
LGAYGLVYGAAIGNYYLSYTLYNPSWKKWEGNIDKYCFNNHIHKHHDYLNFILLETLVQTGPINALFGGYFGILLQTWWL